MPKVAVVTDSASCLPAELVKEYDIRVGPVTLMIAGKLYRDQIDITNEEFFRIQKTLKEMPTTSGVIMGDFLNIFKELSQSTDSIVCIPYSRGLGSCCDSAAQASQLLKKDMPNLNIEVVDSKHAGGAQGFVALEAARAAQAGKSLAEVIAAAQDIIARAKMLFAMDTLKYLIKGGRAPKAAGLLGELIQMKPIVGFINGTGMVDFSDRVRTTPKALVRIIEIVRKHTQQDKPLHVMIHYSDDIEKGQRFKEMIAAEFDCAELYMTPWTPVMCAHTGPLIGLGFYS